MSRAKTPRSPRFDQVVISVFFACFASWRENGMCETNPICHPGQAGGVPAGADRAKQSQSPPEMPTIPSRGQSCKTNPITGRDEARGRRMRGKYAKRTQFAPGPGGTRRGVLYKQTQFLPLCRSGDRRSREGKSCETKPNLGAPAVSGGRRVDGARCGKQSQFPAGPGGTGSGDEDREGQSCKTNPIFATSGGSRAGTPNLRRADCAKRSQTWAGWDIWGTARRGRPNGAKRTQFPATPGGMGLEGRATRSKRAKRTQFTRRYPAGRARRGTRRGANAQNEPNSQGSS